MFKGRAIYYCPVCVDLIIKPMSGLFEFDNDIDGNLKTSICCPVCKNNAEYKFKVNDTNGNAECDYYWYHIFRDYRETPSHEIEFVKLSDFKKMNFDTGEIFSKY